jgi:hypothetical protein
MRKVLILTMALVLMSVAASMPASAKKKKPKPPPQKVERTATSDYQAPAIGIAANGGAGVCLVPTNSCGNLPPGAGELYIKVSISDPGGDVAFSVGQDTDPATPGTENDLGLYCGAMETTVAIEPGVPITVFPWLIGLPECPAAATAGTVTIVFSNLP